MRPIPIYFLLIILALFTTCRKKTPRTMPENAEVMPMHCFNGIKDGDELSTDCGGSCSECTFVTAPCATTLNTVSITGSATQVYTNATGSVVSGNYRITCSNGFSNDITIDFYGTTITPNQVFTIPAGSPFGSSECSMDLTVNGVSYIGVQGGKVYVNEKNGKYTVDFCSLDIYSYSSGLTKQATGNLTCN